MFFLEPKKRTKVGGMAAYMLVLSHLQHVLGAYTPGYYSSLIAIEQTKELLARLPELHPLED